ncbi:MAG: hypothetical protein CBC29_02320 [Methylococcaceae bacterium TMED69]|nr:MAG: hypothetical protein CBC29_02320 [Methylococcaceae bacterium TMED69]|tara:strand:+ start:106 stop:399 length:294 start_codon:yes stop_codon:yes gene_type:complete
MAAYIIANVLIDNPTRYADYTALTPGIIKKYKGEFVVRGGPVEALEGKTKGERWVVLRFEDKDAARAFYDSEEYTAAKEIRQEAATAQFLLLDGFDS